MSLKSRKAVLLRVMMMIKTMLQTHRVLLRTSHNICGMSGQLWHTLDQGIVLLSWNGCTMHLLGGYFESPLSATKKTFVQPSLEKWLVFCVLLDGFCSTSGFSGFSVSSFSSAHPLNNLPHLPQDLGLVCVFCAKRCSKRCDFSLFS